MERRERKSYESYLIPHNEYLMFTISINSVFFTGFTGMNDITNAVGVSRTFNGQERLEVIAKRMRKLLNRKVERLIKKQREVKKLK